MRLKHRMDSSWAPRNDPKWEERIEREAQRTTDATEKAWRDTQARLKRAEERLLRAQQREAQARENKAQKLRLKKLAEIVERRRRELQAIHAEMTRTPAGSQHRGRGSYRGVGTAATPPINPRKEDSCHG